MFIAFLAATTSSLPQAVAIDPGSWFTADDYPIQAQKQGVQGQTSFRVDVDAQGRPTACHIAKSSGSPILDQTTCDIVLKRARFKPAVSHGEAVAGSYTQNAIWRLQGPATANGYFATIVDFSKDPTNPTCSIVSKGLAPSSACELALKAIGIRGPSRNMTQVVALVSITSGDAQPYGGNPDWGPRLSFTSIDLYAPADGSKMACSVLATEGRAQAENPCARYADASALSPEERKSAKKTHIESSIFGIERPAPSDAKCKSGESAAEVQSCN